MREVNEEGEGDKDVDDKRDGDGEDNGDGGGKGKGDLFENKKGKGEVIVYSKEGERDDAWLYFIVLKCMVGLWLVIEVLRS